MRQKIFYTTLTLLVTLNAPTYPQDLFGPKTDYGTGVSPTGVFSADLDGDNDLVAANERSDDVSVLLNNVDGTFADKVDYTTGDFPTGVFSVDLDGDGDNDLAVANRFRRNVSNVSVLLNLSTQP